MTRLITAYATQIPNDTGNHFILGFSKGAFGGPPRTGLVSRATDSFSRSLKV